MIGSGSKQLRPSVGTMIDFSGREEKQLADVKGLVCSYQRDLEKQQEIEMLKGSHQPPYQGNWNFLPELRPAGAAWPEERRSLPEPAQFPRGPIRNGGGSRACSGPQPGDTCRNCRGRATGPMNVELSKSMVVCRWDLKP